MGGSETPLEIRIRGINQNIDLCNQYLIRIFQADSENPGQPSCANIVSAIKSRAKGDDSDYEALVQKLENEELSEVSTLQAQEISYTSADVT